MRYWTYLLIILAFFSGIAIQGLFSLRFGVAEIIGLIGSGIVVIKAITDIFKENIFEYSGTYKKDDIRIDYETGGWLNTRLVEKARHNETTYCLRITKKRGSGRLEECEGFLTFSNRKHVPTAWEGPNFQKTRSISVQDDLRLFNVSEDKKSILIL